MAAYRFLILKASSNIPAGIGLPGRDGREAEWEGEAVGEEGNRKGKMEGNEGAREGELS